MVCADGGSGDECSWDPDQPSPGSQGSPCDTGLECRSGICEQTYCVVECNPADADPCPDNPFDPENPFTCQPSEVVSGTSVCIGAIITGGGGFCAAGGRGPGWALAGARDGAADVCRPRRRGVRRVEPHLRRMSSISSDHGSGRGTGRCRVAAPPGDRRTRSRE
jgi:hypothetical protein